MYKKALIVIGILSTAPLFAMEGLWENEQQKEWNFIEGVVKWADKLPLPIRQSIGEYVMSEEQKNINLVADQYYSQTERDAYRDLGGNDYYDTEIKAAVVSDSNEFMAICLRQKSDVNLYGVHLLTGRIIQPVLSDTKESDSITICKRKKSDKGDMSVQELTFNDKSNVLKLVLQKNGKREMARYFNAYSLYEFPEYQEKEMSEFSRVGAIDEHVLKEAEVDPKVLRKGRFYLEQSSQGRIKLYDSERYTIIKEFFQKPKTCALACALYYTMHLALEHRCCYRLEANAFLYSLYKKNVSKEMYRKLCFAFQNTIWK